MKFFRESIGNRWLRIAAGILTLGLCACLMALPGSAKAEFDTKNWMQKVPDWMQISQINIPGTHDTGAYYMYPAYRRTAQTQDWNFQEQLDHGLRNFDIRLGKYGSDKYEMNICHGDSITVNCYTEPDPNILTPRLLLKDIMKTADDFVKEHPSETVILMIRDEAGGDYCNEKIGEIMKELHHSSGPGNKNYPHCVAYNVGEEVPMLREVRGKVVVLCKKIQNASGGWETVLPYTDYATSYKWRDWDDKVGGSYTTPKVKRMEVEKNLIIATKCWPQLYAGVSHDKFTDAGTRLENLDVRSKTTAPISAPILVSTNLTGIMETDLLIYGPRFCWDYLYDTSMFSFRDYAGFKNVSLYTENRRTGWWQFDFPLQNHINDIIISNYTVLDEYRIVIDTTDYWESGWDLDDFTVSLEAESSGMKTTITSQDIFVHYDKEYWYYNDLGTFARSVTIDPNTAHFNFQLPENCYIELKSVGESPLQNGGTQHIYTYEVIDLNKPVEADITVEWANKLDYANRPQTLAELYKLLGLDQNTVMTFQAVDSRGNRREFKVPGDANVTEFIRVEETDSCHMWVRDLPGNDGVGGRLSYTELILPELPENSNYTMTVEKHPKYPSYTIKLNYKKPEGISEVDLLFNWVDGDDTYGLRKAANDYIINADGTGYDIRNNYKVYSEAGTQLDIKLLDASPLDDRKGLHLTLQERDSRQNVALTHTFERLYLNQEFPAYPNLHYWAVAGKKIEYKANINGEPTHYISFAYNLYLLGDCDITVTWVGDDPNERPNYYGLSVSLPGSETAYGGTTVTVPSRGGNVWTGHGENRQIYDDNNQKIEYTKENLEVRSNDADIELDGYEMSFIVTEDLMEFGKAPHCTIDIVMMKSSYTDIRGTVEWHDGNLSLTHEHPAISVIQRYMRDPSKGMTGDNIIELGIPADKLPIVWNGDSYSFSDITWFPAYKENGSPCTYRIQINDMDEYSAVVNGWDATLTRNIVVSGTVDWEDPAHRPSATQPTVQLVRDGKLTGACVTEKGFTYVFDPVPVADGNNVPYEYDIAVAIEGFEEADNLEISPLEPVQDKATGNITADAVLRLLSEERIAGVPVQLTLVNSDPATEPESFFFLLEGENQDGPYQSILTLNSENSFEGRFVMDSSRFADGQTYSFTVTQMPGASPYWDYDDAVKPVTVKVVYLNGKPTAQVDMGGDTAVRFTDTRLENARNISVGFDWLDASWCRPDTVTLHLLADGVETRTVEAETFAAPEYVFENLPVFRDELPRTVIEYTLTADAPARYTAAVTGNADDGFTVTFTQLISVSGTVDWEGGKRPMNNQPTVQLFRNGEAVGNPVEETNFFYNFENLPAVDEDFVLYEYSIAAELAGAEVTITYDPVEREYGTCDITANATIRPINAEQDVAVPVALTLVNSDPATEPESFSFMMEGENRNGKCFFIMTLDRDNAFTGQYVMDGSLFDDNTDYAFTVKQIPGDKPVWDYDEHIADVKVRVAYLNGQRSAIVDMGGDTAVRFTNTRLADTESITVSAVWIDAGRDEATRPGEMDIRLLGDGKEARTVTLNRQENWTHTAEGLPLYRESLPRTAIDYTVEAEAPEGYTAVVTGDTTHGFTVTYTAMISVNGSVDWENGARPANNQPVVQLVRNGELFGEPLEETDFAYSFAGLPIANELNEAYSWSIIATLEGFDATFTYQPVIQDLTTGNVTANAVITAMKDPVDAELPVTLKLEGIDPADVTESFVFVMKSVDDGDPISATVTLERANNFTDSFTLDAAQFERNASRRFAVTQVAGNNAFWEYDQRTAAVTVTVVYINGKPVASVRTDDQGLTFTNVYHGPIDTGNIHVQVQWDTKQIVGLMAPDSVYVVLKADGKEVQRATVSAGDNWAHRFMNLPIYTSEEGGEPIRIVYTVTAEKVESFDDPIISGDSKLGFTVTYTVPDATRDVDVTVEWDTEHLNGRKIPESVEVALYADGMEVQRAKVTAAQGWKYQFKDLPSYTEGDSPRMIEYTVSAGEVDSFEKPEITGNDANGFNIYYGVPSGTVDIAVQIRWVDTNKKPRAKPASVKVELFANGASAGSLTLSANNGWRGFYPSMPLTLRPSAARRPMMLAAVSRPAPRNINYKLVAQEIKDYTVQVSGSAKNGYTVTYTAKPYIPHTGDSTPILPLLGLLLLSLGGIVGMNLRRRRV